MITIKHVTENDKAFWYSLDKHLPKSEFTLKVRDKRGYIVYNNDTPVGIIRYNLFWDNTPFLTLIYIDEAYHKKGFGKQAMLLWENEMRQLGFKIIIISTQVNESSQHFYRKLGYKDKGSIVIDIPPFEQPLEIFMTKPL